MFFCIFHNAQAILGNGNTIFGISENFRFSSYHLHNGQLSSRCLSFFKEALKKMSEMSGRLSGSCQAIPQ